MKKPQAGLIGGVQVIHQHNNWSVRRKASQESQGGVEQGPMFLLGICGTRWLEVSDGVLAALCPQAIATRQVAALGQVAVKRFDEGLVGQLSFLFISGAGENDHPG